MNNDIFAKPAPSKLDDLLDRVNARQIEEGDGEIPEPGTEENPWIGFEYVRNGQKVFHALSGRERRQLRRRAARTEAAESALGQRRYNRLQRQREFDAGTVRQQARILQGEIPVTPAMMGNLQSAILRQIQNNRTEETADERKAAKQARRAERLRTRQMIRIHEGRARHSDLVAAFGAEVVDGIR